MKDTRNIGIMAVAAIVLMFAGLLWAGPGQAPTVEFQRQRGRINAPLDTGLQWVLLCDATTNQAVQLDRESLAAGAAAAGTNVLPDGTIEIIAKQNSSTTTANPNGMFDAGGVKNVELLFMVGCNSNATPTGNFCFTLVGCMPGADITTNSIRFGHGVTLFDCSSALAGADLNTVGDPMCGADGNTADANSAYAMVTALTVSTDSNLQPYSSYTLRGVDTATTNGIATVTIDPRGYRYLVGYVRLAATWGSNNMNRVRVYIRQVGLLWNRELFDDRRFKRCETAITYC